MNNLIKTDLNLIVAFQILMEEHNVTRAAERLFISQPAMSKTLARMRDVFDDPLFTRTAHGLIPTPRAKALYEHIPGLLASLERVISSDTFSPEHHQGTFRIACSDTLSFVYADLLRAVMEQSPSTKIVHEVIDDNFYEKLKTGRLDFAIHPIVNRQPELASDLLGRIDLQCVMRSEHPLARKSRLTIKEFLAYPHVRHVLPQITRSGIGVVDEILAQSGRTRLIVFETPYLHSALDAVRNTDCLLALSEPVLNNQTIQTHQFVLLDLPRELSRNSGTFHLLHHQRASHNPAHRWMRELIVTQAREGNT